MPKEACLKLHNNEILLNIAQKGDEYWVYHNKNINENEALNNIDYAWDSIFEFADEK
jgi:hypothetical protein